MRTVKTSLHLHLTIDQGFSLIEVLVALFVLSIGLLGLAMLQVTGIKFNSDSYSRTQATLLAYDVIDKMRANLGEAGAGTYTVADASAATAKINAYNLCSTATCNCGTAACSSPNLALYDLGTWYKTQERSLPQSASQKSTITKNGNEYTITIRWVERDLNMSQSWVVNL